MGKEEFSRRLFLKQNSLIGFGTIAGLGITQNLAAFAGTRKSKDSFFAGDSLETLGGMSLQQLLDFHHRYLTETYIPNWNRGIDWKYGGFDNALSPGKEPNFEKKSMYFQGRGVWMFSYLYNNITHDKRHLEAAVLARDFFVKNALTSDYRWISILERTGKPLSEPLDHYGDIYMLQGLTELYKATKNEQDLEIAIKTAHSVMNRFLSPSYQQVGTHGSDALEPGTSRLGNWQHFLAALTPLLKVRRDPAVEKIAHYCVRAICEYHWQPKKRVLLEVLDDRFRPYTFDATNWGDFRAKDVHGWHAIQACWMVMNEAVRVVHQPTFRQAYEMGIATLEKTYYEGKGITLFDPEDKPPVEKMIFPWGALDDGLVYCLMELEHNHDPLAVSYYNKFFALHNSKPENTGTNGMLHTPRRFFYTIEILDRIISRGGKISGVFG